MKKNIEVVQRIKNCYVSDECVQIMIPYKKNAIIFNKDGIIYSHNIKSIASINNYLTDERRYHFPYSNIPTHREKNGLSTQIYTNQLLNFEEPYISLIDGNFIERYVVKDGDEALMIKKLIPGFEKKEYKTRLEVEKIFEKPVDENEKRYIIDGNGVIANEDEEFVPDEDRILEDVKSVYYEILQNIRKYGEKHDLSIINHYVEVYPEFFDLVSQSIDNMNFNQIKKSISVTYRDEDFLSIVKTNGSDIKIQTFKNTFISSDHYEVNTTDFPVTEYTLEQLKYLTPKIISTKELNIPLRLNPGVTKEDIKKAKQLVKEKSVK